MRYSANDIAHFKTSLFLFNLPFVTRPGSWWSNQVRSDKEFIIVIPNISAAAIGPTMIKFISFCPKMINSADFVIPTIMPTQ